MLEEPARGTSWQFLDVQNLQSPLSNQQQNHRKWWQLPWNSSTNSIRTLVGAVGF